jgi:hypothetical protein
MRLAYKSRDYRTGTISFERIKMALSKYQTNGDDMGDIKLIEKQIEGLDDKEALTEHRNGKTTPLETP